MNRTHAHDALENNPHHRYEDPATFTCEVCQISVRSAQKLLDHVNFSPLHKAALEGNRGEGTGPNRFKPSAHRRMIYEGSKLFWRINETLEITIYEDTGANFISITAFQSDLNHKVPTLYLELKSLLRALNTSGQVFIKDRSKDESQMELLNRYLLARLHAKKDARGSVCLFFQKLNEDVYEPNVLSNHGTSGEIVVRRRHSYDACKQAEAGVKEAAMELKNARLKAEHLSNLARMTLDTVSPKKMQQEQLEVALPKQRRYTQRMPARFVLSPRLQSPEEFSKEAK